MTQEIATEAKVDGRVNNGRKPILADRDAKADILLAIRNGEAIPSRFILNQLVNEGLVSLAVATVAEGEKRGRGRPSLVPSLTGKARTWVANIERSRTRAAEKAAAAATEEQEQEQQEEVATEE